MDTVDFNFGCAIIMIEGQIIAVDNFMSAITIGFIYLLVVIVDYWFKVLSVIMLGSLIKCYSIDTNYLLLLQY